MEIRNLCTTVHKFWANLTKMNGAKIIDDF